jgi:uncharacterized protein (TIGR02453 family)
VTFTGLDPDALAFFAELEVHNTREWWAANKARYEEHVRGPFEALAAELSPEFGAIKVFRPNRDVRFSADKSPYKLQIGMMTDASAAHFLQLDATELLIGGGSYDLSPAALAAFRARVDDDVQAALLRDVLSPLEAEGFALMTTDALRTAPRGYSADHPRIDLLRLKRLAVGRRIPPAAWMWTPGALDEIRDDWRAISAWCAWLTEHVHASA